MAHWWKMWWLIGVKCGGSLVEDKDKEVVAHGGSNHGSYYGISLGAL